MYNDIMQQVTHIQDDYRVSEQRMKELKSAFDILVENLYKVVLHDKEGTDVIDDGDGKLVWYGQSDDHAIQPKRK